MTAPAAPVGESGLREALGQAEKAMTCRDGHAHYCPTCDNTSYEGREAVRAALRAIATQENNQPGRFKAALDEDRANYNSWHAGTSSESGE